MERHIKVLTIFIILFLSIEFNLLSRTKKTKSGWLVNSIVNIANRTAGINPTEKEKQFQKDVIGYVLFSTDENFERIRRDIHEMFEESDSSTSSGAYYSENKIASKIKSEGRRYLGDVARSSQSEARRVRTKDSRKIIYIPQFKIRIRGLEKQTARSEKLSLNIPRPEGLVLLDTYKTDGWGSTKSFSFKDLDGTTYVLHFEWKWVKITKNPLKKLFAGTEYAMKFIFKYKGITKICYRDEVDKNKYLNIGPFGIGWDYKRKKTFTGEYWWWYYFNIYLKDSPYLNKFPENTIRQNPNDSIQTLEPSNRPELMSIYKTLSKNDVQLIIKRKNFFADGWNKSGDFRNDYKLMTINGDKVVIDRATGLMWHQSGSLETMYLKNVNQWVNELNQNRYAGHSDWRLPTVEEAASLLENRKMNGDLHIDPRFSRKQSNIWTGDKYSGSDSIWDGNRWISGRFWVIYFYLGEIAYWYHLEEHHFYVRPVRGLKQNFVSYRVIDVRNDDVLSIRKFPHWTSDIVGTIPYNGRNIIWLGEKELVEGTKKNFEWYKIKYNGVTGWVNRKYIERY
jgi:hypothetical protein